MQTEAQIVAIIGPESTGKSTLCGLLSKKFNGTVVPEFAREFLSKTNGKYDQSDLITITKGQLKLENDALSKSPNLVFCDTDALVVKVWHEFKYGKTNAEIDVFLRDQPPRKYLLTYPDLNWEPDSLRENPNDLLELFEYYESELKKMGADYRVIKGQGDQRLANAIEAVNQMKLG